MRRPLLLLCVAFVPLLGGGALAAVAAGAHPHNLPIGKSVSTTGPARRSIDACAVMSGGGAFASGSWIHADGTFDVTAKPTVKGDVAWPNASITFTTVNGRLTVKSNGLPKGTRTGIYPVAAGSAAYRYDRNPNRVATQSVDVTPPKPAAAARPACLTGARSRSPSTASPSSTPSTR